MGDILFLTHRIPYPPNKGDKIRAYHLLQFLRRLGPVHLGCFVDDAEDWAHVKALEALCAAVHCVPLGRRWAALKSGLAFFTGEAQSVRFYGHDAMRNWVEATLARENIDRLVAFSSTMAPYVLPYRSNNRRLVMDFVDVDSEKWRQYAQCRRGPMRWLYRREAMKLLAFERLVASQVDASLFVSEAEAALFRRLAPQARDVHAIANGVDARHFDPAQVTAADLGDGPVLVFTGAMDYWANADAVTWFVRESWPLVLARHPSARLYIVGAKPLPAVKSLAHAAGVVVTGRVPDVRHYLKAARLAIAPMRIARGIQNKVLEAMAMARPVVTTSAGLEGIDAPPGEALYVADDAAGFARAVGALLEDAPAAEEMGARARRLVCARHDWHASLAPLTRLLGGEGAGADPRHSPGAREERQVLGR